MQGLFDEVREQVGTFPEDQTTAAHARLALFEDCASAIDQLFAQALETRGLAAFDEFIDFMARFNHLSVYNSLLVRV